MVGNAPLNFLNDFNIRSTVHGVVFDLVSDGSRL